nr:MAG TPA: hypothetical protein [Bacteriophage sp.]
MILRYLSVILIYSSLLKLCVPLGLLHINFCSFGKSKPHKKIGDYCIHIFMDSVIRRIRPMKFVHQFVKLIDNFLRDLNLPFESISPCSILGFWFKLFLIVVKHFILPHFFELFRSYT